jgi:two-component system sensor histidine kinase KdpD
LTTDVGAHWHEAHADDPAQSIFEFARAHQITQIVVGSSSRSRWQELKGGGSIVRKISLLAAPAGIDVHIIARRNATPEVTSIGDKPEDPQS